MKKKISLLLAILMLVTLLPTAFAESKTADARKTSQKITLDGQAVDIGAYNIEEHNYVKLRDVAAIMTAKKSQFNVGYDAEKNLVIVETDKPYTKEAGDLEAIKDAKAKAMLEVKKIMVNGEAKDIKTALIKGNNYMQLRDLGRLVGFDVGYDEKTKTVLLSSEVKAAKAPRYVMIKSKLYKDTEEINKNMKCGTMDGKILTSVDAKEMPKKDNESNFGTGYEYQIGTDGSITVEIDDKCYIFKEVKEDKKEEKTEEKFSKEDNAIFDRMIAQNNTVVNKYKYYDQVPLTDDNPMATIVNMSTLYGARIYTEGAKIEKSIEDVDGFRTHVIKFTYPGGGVSIMKTVPAEKEGKFQFSSSAQVGPVIRFIDDEKDIRKMSKEELQEKFTMVHDALADKDYKKASEILRELNYDASEEMVKEIAERKIADAKRFGGEIFSKDYEVNYVATEFDSGKYIMFIFIYKNGTVFRFDVYPPIMKGFASIVLVPHN